MNEMSEMNLRRVGVSVKVPIRKSMRVSEKCPYESECESPYQTECEMSLSESPYESECEMSLSKCPYQKVPITV